MKISWIQGKHCGSVEANAEYYLNSLSQVRDADLVVLPELFLTHYFPIVESDEFLNLAIEDSHPLVKSFQNKAREKNVVLVFPYYECRAPGIYHNSCLVFERDGSVAGKYRKMHIPDDPGFYEKYYFIPGDLGFEPIQTSVGKLGVLICWDQWFPEAARLMALKGADVLIYPTAIGWDDTEPEDVNPEQLEAWQTAMRAHAIANGLHVIAVNRIGQEGHLNFWGNSFVARPSGQIQLNSGLDEGLFNTDIDLNLTKEHRHIWPYFRDRRVDAYKDILKVWVGS